MSQRELEDHYANFHNLLENLYSFRSSKRSVDEKCI